MSAEQHIAFAYCLMLGGFLVLGLTIRYMGHIRRTSTAQHRAIVSALGYGQRIVISAGVVGGYPYRVAIGRQVFGFKSLGEALRFIDNMTSADSGKRARARENAPKVHHPSLSA